MNIKQWIDFRDKIVSLPCLMAWHAEWRATRDEEHALSIANEGPVRLKTKEILLAATLIAVPVPL